MFKQILRPATVARRQLSTSTTRFAGFGQAGKDDKTTPASKSTLSDQVSAIGSCQNGANLEQNSATGSDLHEANKGDAGKAGANAKVSL